LGSAGWRFVNEEVDHGGLQIGVVDKEENLSLAKP